MNEIINTVNYNTLGAANSLYGQNTIKTDANAAFPGIMPKTGINKDSFVHSKEYADKNSKNPVTSSIDNFLARFLPSLYIDKYLNGNVIENAVKTNPEITELLAAKGLEPKVYIENVKGKNKEHFLTTYNKAKELGRNLPLDEYSTLLQSSLLHDIGKAFIPPEILNKPGALTENEREIINLHAEIGAEILETAGLPQKTVEAVRLHHTDWQDSKKINNKTAQILSAADVYSALKEERPYKKPFSDEEAMKIMQNDSKLNPSVVKDVFSSKN